MRPLMIRVPNATIRVEFRRHRSSDVNRVLRVAIGAWRSQPTPDDKIA